jgi:hypothetical protein
MSRMSMRRKAKEMIVLSVLFGYRYAIKTGQFIPSGRLAVIRLVVLGVMILTIDRSPQPAAGG